MGMSGGGGGGGSASRGFQYQGNLAQSLQQIWAPQANALSNMYGGVSNLMNAQAGQMQQAAAGQVGNVYGHAATGIENLNRIAGGDVGPLSQYAQPNNQLAQQQLADYSQQVGQEFARNIMPQLRTNAQGIGGLGGARDYLAQGVAAGDAARTISQGATNLYGQQYATGAQAAQALGQIRLGAAGALPGAAQDVYNLGMQPYQAAWAPYTAAAGIFGGPTALSMQQSLGLGENWNNQAGNPQKGNWGFQLF